MLSAEKNRILTQVGPGTPMGDYMRRYWMPIAGASELDASPIKPVRLFGEDLVMFKDDKGRYGLVGRHCPHRGTDLAFGRLEDGEKIAGNEDAGGQDEGNRGGDEQAPVATASVLGMTVGELNDDTRKKFGIAADVSGVVITDVAKDSAAAERGIQAGEVITEIAQESVASPKDVMDRIAALKDQGRKNALLMLASKSGELRFVTVRMD